MRRLGAFRDERSRDRLRRIGVDLDADGVDSANLLPHDLTGVPWDAGTARIVAESWSDHFDRYDEVVVAGGDAAVAVGVVVRGNPLADVYGERVPASAVGRDVIVVPHPSGRNLWWNGWRRVEILENKIRELSDACSDL